MNTNFLARSMAHRIPDLWNAKEKDATRLYAIYIARLTLNDRHERVVSACRQIRRYAARGPGPKEGLFTFSDEIDSLCELRKYKEAWRQLRAREEVLFGGRFELRIGDGPFSNPYELEWHYAPLLFFLERYRDGCSLLEIALDAWFNGRELNSYENLLFRVYNDDDEPWHRCRVTLAHFYNELGQDLAEWRHWNEFVNGFHPKLFRLSGVSRTDLRANAGLLPEFYGNLLAIRDKRVPTRVGGGLRDLIDSPEKVKKRQDTTRRQMSDFDKRAKAKRQRINLKLRELFPELQELAE